MSKKKVSNKSVAVEVNEIDTALEALNGKSAKIRYLTSIGWGRREIANKLGVIYQHVRNVQVTLLKKDMTKA